MAPGKSGRRTASPLLKELRLWERRTRRGVFPRDELVSAWDARIATAGDTVESAELAMRLDLIRRAVTLAQAAHQTKVNDEGVQPLGDSAPPFSPWQGLDQFIAGAASIGLGPSLSGHSKDPASVTGHRSTVQVELPALASPAADFIHALAHRTTDFLAALTAFGGGAPSSGGYRFPDMPLVVETELQLDWVAGEPDPWRQPDVIAQARETVESLATRGVRVKLVRGRPVPPARYRPAAAQPSVAFTLAGPHGPIALDQLKVVDQAVLVAQRPGLLHVVVPPTRYRPTKQAAAGAQPGAVPAVPTPGLPPLAWSERSTLGMRPPVVDQRRFISAPTARPIVEPSPPIVSPAPLLPFTAPVDASPRPALPPLPPPAIMRAIASKAGLPTSLGSFHPPGSAGDRRESSAPETVRIALSWIAGADPWQRPELIERTREAARELEARGIRVELVRGSAVAAHRYVAGQGQPAGDFILPGRNGPVIPDGLDILDQAVLIAQHPGLLQVLVAPESVSSSAANRRTIPNPFDPVRPDASPYGPALALTLAPLEQESGVESGSATAAEPAIDAHPMAAPERGRRSPGRFPTPALGRAAHDIGIAASAVSAGAGTGLRTRIGAASSALIPTHLALASGRAEVATTGAERRSETVKIALDWVAGDGPWQQEGLLEQAHQVARALRERGIPVELVRGRQVSPTRYDPRQGRPAADFSLSSPTGPVLLDRLEILDRANLVAQRPGFLRVLVAPRRVRQADLSETVAAPIVLSPLASRVFTSEVVAPLTGTAAQTPRANSPFGAPLSLLLASLAPDETAEGTIEPTARSRASATPLATTTSARQSIGEPKTVSISLDWVAGADPWQQTAVIERAREAARAFEARGLRVEIVRGRPVAAYRYDVSQGRPAASFSVSGPVGPVVLEPLDVLDQSMLIAQRPGVLHVLVAPTVSQGKRPTIQTTDDQRPLERSIGDLTFGPALTFALPEAVAEADADSPESGRTEMAPRGRREHATATTERDGRQRRAPETGVIRRPPTRPEQVRILLDWVAGQDPWRRGSVPSIPPEVTRRLANQGVQLEFVRGREVPAALYQAAQAQAGTPLTVKGPRGSVSLDILGWLSTAVPVAQRPGQLQVILGQSTEAPPNVKPTPLPLVLISDSALAESTDVVARPTTSGSARDLGSSPVPLTALSSRIHRSSAAPTAARIHAASTIRSAWTGDARRSRGSFGFAAASVDSSLSMIGPSATIGQAPRWSSPEPLIPGSPDTAAPTRAAMSPSASLPLRSAPASIAAATIQRLSAVEAGTWDESATETGSPRSTPEGPTERLRMMTPSPAPWAAPSITPTEPPGGGFVVASPRPMNVLVFDVTRTESGPAPSLVASPATVEHPAVGSAITRTDSGRSAAAAVRPTPAMPAFVFARDSAPDVLPLRRQDVARAESDRPTVSPRTTSPVTTATASDAVASSREQPNPPDLDLLSRQVYAMVKQRLAVERERLGKLRTLRTW